MNYTMNQPWITMISDRSWSVRELFDFYHITDKKRSQFIHNQKIRVNQQVADLNTLIFCNDQISVCCFENAPNPHQQTQSRPCTVVYEDDFVLVVSKPPGLIIHDDGNAGTKTLDQQVAAYYQTKGYCHQVRAIHRLDRDTSGCVLYSKCEFFQPFLDALLSEKKIYREYEAVTDGIIPWNKKTIALSIGQDRHHNQRQRISRTGKPAITHVEVIKRNPQKKTTLIRCRLETGRTHQIRVHLKAEGFPLLGDALYGRKSEFISHCALHAVRLVWLDPVLLKRKEAIDSQNMAIKQCI